MVTFWVLLLHKTINLEDTSTKTCHAPMTTQPFSELLTAHKNHLRAEALVRSFLRPSATATRDAQHFSALERQRLKIELACSTAAKLLFQRKAELDNLDSSQKLASTASAIQEQQRVLACCTDNVGFALLVLGGARDVCDWQAKFSARVHELLLCNGCERVPEVVDILIGERLETALHKAMDRHKPVSAVCAEHRLAQESTRKKMARLLHAVLEYTEQETRLQRLSAAHRLVQEQHLKNPAVQAAQQCVKEAGQSEKNAACRLQAHEHKMRDSAAMQAYKRAEREERSANGAFRKKAMKVARRADVVKSMEASGAWLPKRVVGHLNRFHRQHCSREQKQRLQSRSWTRMRPPSHADNEGGMRD